MKDVSVITSTAIRGNLSDTLDEVDESKKITLIKRNRNINWALVSADLLEDLLELHDDEYLKSIVKARKEVEKGKVYTLDQAFTEL